LKRFTRIDSGLPQVAVVLSGRIRLNLSYGGVSLTLLRQGSGGQALLPRLEILRVRMHGSYGKFPQALAFRVSLIRINSFFYYSR